jgi:hypothetical protein
MHNKRNQLLVLTDVLKFHLTHDGDTRSDETACMTTLPPPLPLPLPLPLPPPPPPPLLLLPTAE